MGRLVAVFMLALTILGVVALITPGLTRRADVPTQTPQRAVSSARASLASVESADGSVRLDVLALHVVSSEILEIRFALTNLHAQGLGLGHRFAEGPKEAGTVSAAFVANVDRPSRHFVLRDGDGRPSCSNDLQRLDSAERREGWARFGSPGGPGTRIALQLKGFPLVGGLTVPGST